MKTRILIFALIFAIMCCFCSCKEEQDPRFVEGSIVITAENHPIIAVTEMNSEIALNLTMSVLDCTEQEAYAFIITCKTPDECYEKLANGECDLVIAHEPSETAMELLTEKGVTVTSTTVAVDALVFILSEQNTVSDLDINQISQVYSAGVTDWSAVGGAEGAIRAFSAKEGTAAEDAFTSLIGADKTNLTVPTKTVQTDSGTYLTELSYDNSATAIGYALYNDVIRPSTDKNGQHKLISVGGVYPEASAIQSGTYPLVRDIKATVSDALASDSVVKLYYDWILSDQGVKIIGGSGVILPKN